MNGSKYNDGYSFSTSSFLSLQPEIQVRENIATVEDAYAYYQLVKDDPTKEKEVAEYIWSTVYIPNKFDAFIYLIAYKFQMDISPLNESIRRSMEIDQFSSCEISDGGKFEPSIKSFAKIIADDIFQFDSSGKFEINEKTLRIGDIVQIQPVGHNLSFHIVTVADIIDRYTVHFSSKDPQKTFSDVGRPYEVIGLYVYDLERLSRINYLRHLIKNDSPQSIISVLDTRFNPRLYKILYPATRNLDEYTAYQDYIENKIEDDTIIGKVEDIIKLIKDSGGGCGGGGGELSTQIGGCDYVNYPYVPYGYIENLIEDNKVDTIEEVLSNADVLASCFTNITVKERLNLEFNDTGYLKFNDQYIHYITNNHIRPSRDINNAFPGLITEWAIKKYFEDKIAETVEDAFLEFLKTEDSFEFGGDVIINGTFSALGESNLIMNAQLCNADIVSADIVGIDGEDAMIYMNRDSNVIAYIHDDGMFVSSYLGVNVDIPQHNVDICGDLGVSGPVFFGSDLTVEGTIGGNVMKIDGDESMIFMKGESDVIAYIHDDGMFISSHLGVNVDMPQHNVDICGDMAVSGPAFFGSDLTVEGTIGGNVMKIDGDESMIFMKGESDVIAYIHDDGMFISSYLGVNVDMPQHNVDICGDLAVSGPVYFGSNIVICGEVEGLYGIEGDTMIFMTQDLDVIAYFTEESILLGKPLGVNTDAPHYDVDIVGDFGVSGPAFLGCNLEVKGVAKFDSMVSIGLGIGTVPHVSHVPQDSQNKLSVGGSIRATGNIIAEETVVSESDVRLKNNITPIKNPYDIVKGMNGVMYSLKRDQVEPARRYCGLIAQEVEKVLPEVVEVQANGILSLAYGNVVGVLVEAVKKLIGEEEEEIEITANLVREVKDLKIELEKQKEINNALISDIKSIRDHLYTGGYK